MSKTIRLIDRTRTVQDWKCPRSRYWNYEFMGKGVVKQGTSLELFMGIVIHDAMAAIATFHKEGKPVPIDDIANAANKQLYDHLIEASGSVIEAEAVEFADEQSALIEGLIRGIFIHSWPRLLTGHTIVDIEAENEYFLDRCDACNNTGKAGEGDCSVCLGTCGQFIFMTKPDLLIENDESGALIYLEYKSTSSKKDKWINSWDTAVQLHSSIRAVEATIGRRPDYVQIVGMYKGYESYGKQSSPFCYAYKKSGNPPFTQDQIQYAYKAGFRRYPTWTLPGGVKAWVEGMPENVLADQFPMTPPIMVDDDLVEKFFRQRLNREKEIAEAMNVPFADEQWSESLIDLDETFPQHFDQCEPSFGYPCSYRKLCHGRVEDPLTNGYEWRTPHHVRETEAWGVKNVDA